MMICLRINSSRVPNMGLPADAEDSKYKNGPEAGEEKTYGEWKTLISIE